MASSKPSVSSVLSVVSLLLAWLGYFSPWLWPVPAALRLSGYDLVEWLTFAGSVRDGTYPVTRLDMLWPLACIALLTALLPPPSGSPTETLRERAGGEGEPTGVTPQRREDSLLISSLRVLSVFAVKNWHSILLSLFAAYLVLPAYPFILTAPAEPELRPQLILGIATGTAALCAAALTTYRPKWAERVSAIIALLGLIATLRAYMLTQQPMADIFTHTVPTGYGVYLAVIGFGGMAVMPFKFLASLLPGARRIAD